MDASTQAALIAAFAGVLGAAVGSLAGPIAEGMRANREAKETRRNLYTDFLGVVDDYRINDRDAYRLFAEAEDRKKAKTGKSKGSSADDLVERLEAATEQVVKAGARLRNNTNQLSILAKPEVRRAMYLFGELYGISEAGGDPSHKLLDRATPYLSEVLRADLASGWTSKVRRVIALREFEKFYASVKATEEKRAKGQGATTP